MQRLSKKVIFGTIYGIRRDLFHTGVSSAQRLGNGDIWTRSSLPRRAAAANFKDQCPSCDFDFDFLPPSNNSDEKFARATNCRVVA